MKIRRKFALSSGLIVVLALFQLGLALFLLHNQRLLSDAQSVQHRSWVLSNELRASSDDLTRTARTYVVTGDPTYEKEYWQILAVRDGKAPRSDGRRVSLRRLMEEIGFTEAELGKLNQAEDNSNALVATEVAAFQAMAGQFTTEPGGTSREQGDYVRTAEPDQQFAIRIMHDQKYHQDKERIMSPIREAEEMVTGRTRVEVERLGERSLFLIGFSVAVGLLLVTLVIGAHYYAQRPVLASTELVQQELNEVASGAANLSRRISIRSDDELGQLAAALNRLMDRLEALIRQVVESGVHVSSATTRITAGTKGLEATVTEQVAATNEVVASARAISKTSEGLTLTMEGVAARTEDTARASSLGRDELDRMSEGMAEIERASKLISAKLGAISDRTQSITNVVGTITRVAEQTNLLSLNAAIEAEKAGQYGQGFSVVAREIRRLADQTALATIDIERTVGEMRTAVDGGVATIDVFSQRVRSSVEAVNSVGRNMSHITEQVQAVAPEFESVLRGMKDQSEGAKQISETMADLSETTRQTAVAIDESRRAIDELNDAAMGLQTEVNRLRVGS